jgi:hypothetical protein
MDAQRVYVPVHTITFATYGTEHFVQPHSRK